MFVEMLEESIAKAVFWLLIIGGIGITLRFLIKDIILFLGENIESKEGEE